MKIRNKIFLYFSGTSILLVGLMFYLVYWLFSEYREEDFQGRQKEKIITTLQFITEIEKNEQELTEALDRININSILNEKLLIFNDKKELIYSSLDDVSVSYSKQLLEKLSKKNVWIEQKDELFDVIGIHFTSDSQSYYGISKAYDEFGYDKLTKLRYLLVSAFVVFSILVTLLSNYIANHISKPITQLAQLLGNYQIGQPTAFTQIPTKTSEIDYLNEKFEELVTRTNNAYLFQKNAINHISHELKTPIAILISDLERLKPQIEQESIKAAIDRQITKTKSLAEIINILLEISKIESGQTIKKTTLRADELIFDCISEINTLFPEFTCEVHYAPEAIDADLLLIHGNEMMIKQAFLNLLSNCVAYSDNHKAEIFIDATTPHALKISFKNSGSVITEQEQLLLFTHFFRGANSHNKIGFGLGLALTKNIIEIHGATIQYTSLADSLNLFEITFPI